jgi:hypothetical protein
MPTLFITMLVAAAVAHPAQGPRVILEDRLAG